MVGRLHGNRDIRDLLVDCCLGTGLRAIAVHDLSVHSVRYEILLPVPGNEPAEALAHIDYLELSPQVHESVACRGASEPDDALDPGPDLHQCFEALGLVVLERRELVYHDHVVVERELAFLDQPLYILSVDEVDIRLPHQSSFPFGRGSNGNRVGQMVQLVPLDKLGAPRIPGDPKRSDDQDLVHLKAVE